MRQSAKRERRVTARRCGSVVEMSDGVNEETKCTKRERVKRD